MDGWKWGLNAQWTYEETWLKYHTLFGVLVILKSSYFKQNWLSNLIAALTDQCLSYYSYYHALVPVGARW